MSPSPVPGPGSDDGENAYGSTTSASMEGYSQVDIANLRRRLNDLGYPVARQSNAGESDSALPPGMSSREKELLDMVLSLMTSVPVDPAQLERQAETISSLTAQRDFLVRQAVVDRERWQSERESWERSAEALLLVRNRPSKPEDAERMRMSYEAENKALRDKLHETQRRQAALEAELLKLKPMLLMQPSPISRLDKGKAKEAQPKYQVEFVEQGLNQTQHNALKKQLAAKAAASAHATASTSKAPDASTTPTGAAATNANADSNQQRPRDPKSQPKKTGPPLMSDAYSEHLLLAAKRLGRKRVAFITGYNLQVEKEALAQEQEQARAQQELERAEQERMANGAMAPYYRTGAEASTSASTVGGMPAASPLRVPHIIPVIGNSPLRTPKRGGIHFSNFASAQNNLAAPPETPLVYVNADPVTRSPWAGSGVMGTPRQIKATMGRQNGRATTTTATATPATDKASASNPPTPLASLLDAALLIDGEGSTTSKLRGNSKANGKGRAMDEPESPLPPQKRRRVSASAGAGNGKGNVGQGKGLERVRTALDVLADQADQASAAFIDADQSERRGASSLANSNNAGNKGKGKARERHSTEERAEERNGEVEAGLGRGRATRRESARSIIPPSQMSVISTRPVRQASRRRAVSPPVQQPGSSSSASSARGMARTRGRTKATSNTTTTPTSGRPQRGRVDSEVGSMRIISPPGSRIISPPGPRVIAPGPGYSPLDEAIALSSSRAAGKAPERERERERRSEEHEYERDYTPRHPAQSQRQPQHQTQPNEPKIGGLRPVVAWGQRARPSSFHSGSSPVRGSDRRPPVPPPRDTHDRNDHDNDDEDEDEDDVDELDDDKNDDGGEGATEAGRVSEPSASVVAAAAISVEEPVNEPLPEPVPISAERTPIPASERISVEPNPTPTPAAFMPAESTPAPEPVFVEPTPTSMPVETAPTTESTSDEPTSTPEPTSTKSAPIVESVSVENASIRGTSSRDTPNTWVEPQTPMGVDDAPPDPATLANGHVINDIQYVSPLLPSSSSSVDVQPTAHSHTDDVYMKDPEPTIDEDADAEADIDADDDQDAEGEQEDDEENDDDVVSTKPSRSRSPPPPDPPPPGPSGGSSPGPGQDDEHDPDADAEGEVEFEDNEDHSGSIDNALSTSHRGATTHALSNVHHTQRPTSPYSITVNPKSTCTASREHTVSGLSDTLNTAALGLIISVLTNIPAKLDPKRGWRAHESRFRMFPAKRANKISFKWRNSNGARLGQTSFPGDYARLTNPSLSDSSSSNTAALLRPPTINIRLSCGAPPVIIPSLEVVS
ncbi:hypothetical protein JR316_0004240 [Psilocybe cubensis]|uniref:Uncharacterized protein n=2 Tax=Psilocybe cubensis TaxID=181762 RepID=A0ACB8H346_PSICU|nr:hypothetical protein JR316_0004240 [Psilocybe cubensis]KAH9482145.1 hypothetical protein JR316_0004240 [Psilocybe cubensis]